MKQYDSDIQRKQNYLEHEITKAVDEINGCIDYIAECKKELVQIGVKYGK